MYWTTHLVYERMQRDQAAAFRARLLAARLDADAPEPDATKKKEEQPETAPKQPKRRLLRGSWFPGRAITVPG